MRIVDQTLINFHFPLIFHNIDESQKNQVQTISFPYYLLLNY